LGLTAGPVPARVDGPAKAGLLDLVDYAVGHGWSARRACRLLAVDPDRVAGWRHRATAGRLDDLPCGGGAVHGLLESERACVVDPFEAWGSEADPEVGLRVSSVVVAVLRLASGGLRGFGRIGRRRVSDHPYEFLELPWTPKAPTDTMGRYGKTCANVVADVCARLNY
jgi:hypothetical protein